MEQNEAKKKMILESAHFQIGILIIYFVAW